MANYYEEEIIKEKEYENNQDIELLFFKNATTIEKEAFKDCHHLKKVGFDSNLNISKRVIESRAFANCYELKELHFLFKGPYDEIDIADDAFIGNKNRITFYVPVFGNKDVERYAKKHNYKVRTFL